MLIGEIFPFFVMLYTFCMDLTNVDMGALAEQLRKPEGAMGNEVGKGMVQYNGKVISFTLEALEIQPKDHVLEIGFGPGEGIAEAVQLTPHGYVAGIDHSPLMLQVAQERNHRALMQEHVELTLGSADKLPYENESFDKLFSVNVFHFWPDPARELAECRRVLKPGGVAAFFVWHPSSWPKGMGETGVFIARESQDIEKLLTASGFQNVESREITLADGKGFMVMGKK